MYDAKLKDSYKVGMRGDFDVQVGDPRKCYLYLVGADSDLTVESLQARLMSNVVSVLENEVAEFVSEKEIPFNQLIVKKRDMSAKVLGKLNQKLMSEYGIAVFSFNISNVIIDSDDFNRLSMEYRQGGAKTKEPAVVEKKESQVCVDCGMPLVAGAKFCSNCGKKVGQNLVCPDCNTENSDGSKFCVNCGHKF
ncbi:MAG: zinc-ribbon domain-containing protein [Clostridia bacterium]|nr:zinc-ribbon domain-containing protein [Clostridia bacterium]